MQGLVACSTACTERVQSSLHATTSGKGTVPSWHCKKWRSVKPRQQRTPQALERVRAAHSTSAAESTIQTTNALAVEHLPSGTLVIRPMEEQDMGAASVCLTRGFAVSADIKDGRSYCEGVLQQWPDGLMLVGRLYPTDPSMLRKGQDSRLVSCASLSFTQATREEFPSLQPPPSSPLLCNMAVDPSFRRQGHARRMLAACEALAAGRGALDIHLHARLGDEPALQLYRSAGYDVVDQDSWLVKLRGLTPRALMRKQLA